MKFLFLLATTRERIKKVAVRILATYKNHLLWQQDISKYMSFSKHKCYFIIGHKPFPMFSLRFSCIYVNISVYVSTFLKPSEWMCWQIFRCGVSNKIINRLPDVEVADKAIFATERSWIYKTNFYILS